MAIIGVMMNAAGSGPDFGSIEELHQFHLDMARIGREPFVTQHRDELIQVLGKERRAFITASENTFRDLAVRSKDLDNRINAFKAQINLA